MDTDRDLFDRLLTKPVKPTLLIHALIQLTQPHASEGAQDSARRAQTPPTLAGLRVLLADDNRVNQLVAKHMLKRLGIHAHCIANGRDALEALHTTELDVMLMGCQMPEMDGYAATGLFRGIAGNHLNSGIPIIALTANARATDRERCLAAGMTDFLTKPIELSRLEESLLMVRHAGESPSLQQLAQV